jgi:hypothetical protein
MFSSRNDAVAATRAALLETASVLGVLGAFPYTGRLGGGPDRVPEATIREEASVDELLGALNNHWDRTGEGTAAVVELIEALGGRLREALLAFGDAFDLYSFSRARAPETPREVVERYSLDELVAWFDRVWHEQAGCLGHLPSEREEDLVVDQTARNLMLISAFRDELGFSPEVVSNYAKIRPTPLYNEVRLLCRHAIETYFPDAAQDPQIRGARARATEVAADQADDVQEAFSAAVADAVAGLLTYGIASDPITETLLKPFANVIPLRQLLHAAAPR